MNAVLIPVACPLCGGLIRVVNASPGGTESIVIVECVDCGQPFTVTTLIRRGPVDPTKHNAKIRDERAQRGHGLTRPDAPWSKAALHR